MHKCDDVSPRSGVHSSGMITLPFPPYFFGIVSSWLCKTFVVFVSPSWWNWTHSNWIAPLFRCVFKEMRTEMRYQTTRRLMTFCEHWQPQKSWPLHSGGDAANGAVPALWHWKKATLCRELHSFQLGKVNHACKDCIQLGAWYFIYASHSVPSPYIS